MVNADGGRIRTLCPPLAQGWLTIPRLGSRVFERFVDYGPSCSRSGSDQGWRHPLTGANFRSEKGSQFE
jgi:hypothetical protein